MTVTEAGRHSEIRFARRFVQAAGLIFYILAGQALITSAVGLYVFRTGGSSRDLLLPAASLLLAGCYVLIGYFLRRYRAWARNVAFAFAAVSLFALPIGTLFGALIVLCIDRANRARLFPARKSSRVAAKEEPAPALRLESEPTRRAG